MYDLKMHIVTIFIILTCNYYKQQEEKKTHTHTTVEYMLKKRKAKKNNLKTLEANTRNKETQK